MSDPATCKNIGDTEVVLTHRTMPEDANPSGNVFGGVILRLVDHAGAVVALRHCRKRVVTASIERMDFRAPVYVGELLFLKASVNFAGSTSMEVGVRVEAENLYTGNVRHVGSAYLTFVALDDDGKPAPVPPLVPATDEHARRFAEAQARRDTRREERRRERQRQG